MSPSPGSAMASDFFRHEERMGKGRQGRTFRRLAYLPGLYRHRSGLRGHRPEDGTPSSGDRPDVPHRLCGKPQFIATAMLGADAGFLPIVLTTLSINLRHLLMSSSLSLHLRNLSGGRLTLFAYGVTDESFALNMSRFQGGNWGGARPSLSTMQPISPGSQAPSPAASVGSSSLPAPSASIMP